MPWRINVASMREFLLYCFIEGMLDDAGITAADFIIEIICPRLA